MKRVRVWGVVALIAAVSGCAIRMGGPAPVPQDAVALRVTNETAEQLAAQLKQQGVEFAVLSGARDSAFYATVAKTLGMHSTRPGKVGTTTYAFIGQQAVGDTTLTLKVQGGGEIRLHDALYRIDKARSLDILAVHFDANSDIRNAVKSLIQYVSTDVGATAAVLLAVEPPTPAWGDSASVLMRAFLTDAWECTKEGKTHPRNATLPIRLFYGPATRARCDSAEPLANGGGGMLAHLVLLR